MLQTLLENEKKEYENTDFQRTQMQKAMIIQKLREKGCRITRQRQMLLDIILKEECSCCKEIYYQAVKKDTGIGFATVYRMVNTLEEIGAISRKNMYKVACGQEQEQSVCRVELSDHTVCSLSGQKWNDVMRAGLKACGYIDGQEIHRIEIHPGQSRQTAGNCETANI